MFLNTFPTYQYPPSLIYDRPRATMFLDTFCFIINRYQVSITETIGVLELQVAFF
jgi:hypothetical protein